MKTAGRLLAFIRRRGANLLGSLLLGLTLAPNAPLAQPADYFLGRDGIPITVTPGNSPVDHTCNAVVFSQIPGQIDFFIGRARDYAPPGSPTKCEPNRPPGTVTMWLALYKMDWRAHTLSYVREVLRPPFQIIIGDGRTALLKNVYDPSLISYNGELWVAFECGGAGLRGSSACIGPLDPSTYAISDPRRINLLVEGGPAATGYTYSASVPNLFVFHDRAYVYWSALQIETNSKKWVADTIRGMALVQEPSGLRRIWGAGSVGRPASSYDPSLNVEVAGINPTDPMSNQSIDLKGVYANSQYVYVLAGLGGKGPEGTEECVSGGGGSYGCFRPQMFRTASPLGAQVLNRQRLISPKLPFNPTGYDRFFLDDRRQLSILGYFFPPHRDYNTSNLVPAGLWSFPVDLSALRFGP